MRTWDVAVSPSLNRLGKQRHSLQCARQPLTIQLCTDVLVTIHA